MKKFFYFLLIAFVVVTIILLSVYFINYIFGSLFICSFHTSEIDSLLIDAKIKDRITHTIKIPTCFSWMQAPCIRDNMRYTICGKPRLSKEVKCYNYDVEFNSNGTLLPGTYEVIAGNFKAIFKKDCFVKAEVVNECGNVWNCEVID